MFPRRPTLETANSLSVSYFILLHVTRTDGHYIWWSPFSRVTGKRVLIPDIPGPRSSEIEDCLFLKSARKYRILAQEQQVSN